MKEIWKDIIGYEGLYQVSNLGNVRKISPKLLGKSGKRYLKVVLVKDHKSHFVDVHRLVAQAFIPNINNNITVNHINGNKKDNRVENLEWCDSSYNLSHAYENGLRTNNHKVAKTKDGIIFATYRSIQKAAEENHIEYSKLYKAVMNKKELLGFSWVVIE